MWDNIGRKLQSLAKVVCWLGIIGSVIMGIIIMAQNQSTIVTGLLYLVIGCLASWIGSWAMYGLGLVVEYVENRGKIPSSSNPTGNTNTAKTDAETPSEEKKQRRELTENYIVCPNCNLRSSKNYIMAHKKCPQCGKELL